MLEGPPAPPPSPSPLLNGPSCAMLTGGLPPTTLFLCENTIPYQCLTIMRNNACTKGWLRNQSETVKRVPENI